MKLILMRHGTSTGNVDHSQYSKIPDPLIPLTEDAHKGIKSRVSTLRKEELQELPSLLVLYSPWKRAVDTKNIAVQHLSKKCPNLQIKQVECPVIHEQMYSRSRYDMESLNETELAKSSTTYPIFAHSYQSVEPLTNVHTRALTFLNFLKTSVDPDRTVLIVAHGVFLKIFEMLLTNASIDEYKTFRHLDNAEYCVYHLTKEEYIL